MLTSASLNSFAYMRMDSDEEGHPTAPQPQRIADRDDDDGGDGDGENGHGDDVDDDDEPAVHPNAGAEEVLGDLLEMVAGTETTEDEEDEQAGDDGAAEEEMLVELLRADVPVGELIAMLRDANPPPGSTTAVMLELLSSGISKSDLLMQLERDTDQAAGREGLPAPTQLPQQQDGVEAAWCGGAPSWTSSSGGAGGAARGGAARGGRQRGGVTVEMHELGRRGRRGRGYASVSGDDDDDDGGGNGGNGGAFMRRRRPQQQQRAEDGDDASGPRGGIGSLEVDVPRLVRTASDAALQLRRRTPCRVLGVVAAVAMCAALVVVSLRRLPPNTFGLDYSWISRTLGAAPLTEAGLHLVGPLHSLLLVPSTVQTIQYADLGSGARCAPDALCLPPMVVRSGDGLRIRLTLNLLWRYTPRGVRSLYLTMPPTEAETSTFDHAELGELTLLRPAQRVVSMEAHSHVQSTTAQFGVHSFNEKKLDVAKAIGADLQGQLAWLGIEVVALQLMRAQFDAEFEAALMESATTRLQRKKAARYKEAMRVVFRTQSMVARYNVTAVINRARGAGRAREQRAKGNAAATAAISAGELAAYGNVSEATHVAPAELMQYTWWEQAMRLAAQGGARDAPLRTVTMAEDGKLYPQVRSGWTTRG